MDYRFAICDDDGDYAAYIDQLAARWARQPSGCPANDRSGSP